MTKPKIPGWIKEGKERAHKWVLEDVGLTEDQWQALTYEELLELPLIKKLKINPCGGSIKYPGSEIQRNVFTFQCLGEVKHHGGFTNRGENFVGQGKTLPDAVRSAIRVTVELLSMRGKRP